MSTNHTYRSSVEDFIDWPDIKLLYKLVSYSTGLAGDCNER